MAIRTAFCLWIPTKQEQIPAVLLLLPPHTHPQYQTGSDVLKLTTKEGNGTCQEGCEANIQGPVNQASGEAVGDAMLDKAALDHVQDRHRVDLQQAKLMVRHAAV